MSLNGISTSTYKADRQLAKLQLSKAKREGRTITEGSGTWVASTTTNISAPFYRSRNVYDISELPTKYVANDVYNNLNEGGLIQGRPWATTETPNLISGLRFWIDTATTSTLNGGTYTDGAALTAWTERKQAAAYVDPAANRRATIQSGSIDQLNGYPVVRFATATSDWDQAEWTSVSGLANATGYTMVCVAKLTANATAGVNHILRISNTSGGFSSSVYYATAAGRFEVTAPTGSATVDNTVDPDGTWKIVTVRYDSTAAAASRVTFRWDKTARTVTNAATAPSGALAADAGSSLQVGYFWNADFGEMLVYNTALSDAQIIALEDYLSSKWFDYTDPVPVTGSLVAYYDPSNTESYPGTGTTLTNLMGNSLNGTMSNLTYTSPYFTYNGTSSTVSIADNASIEPGSGDFTLEAWVYHSTITGSSRIILGKTDGGLAGDWGYGLRTASNGNTYFEVGNGTTSVTSPSSTLSTGTWYQVVGVWTNVASDSIALYVNGSLVGSNSHTFASIKNTTNPLYLGSFNNGQFSQWFNGRMGVVRYYNKALSAAEITTNYNADKSKYGL